ncbi:hypothetical protein Nepgr_024026 [Nepenthes gracilis]|uniref:Uncharacterized protein n=1 Tax=Nepenthes gracilis TaxID=150966 RepID=A0AAD3XYE3_NEPGR|nr:hypothetical protein Nepgr_024026 [Nepenthes gracilis]
MGSTDSLDSDAPTYNPPSSSGSQVVHQMSQEGMLPTEKSVVCGPLGTQLVCPVPQQPPLTKLWMGLLPRTPFLVLRLQRHLLFLRCPLLDNNKIKGKPVCCSRCNRLGHSSSRCHLTMPPHSSGRPQIAHKPLSSRGEPSKAPPIKETPKPPGPPSPSLGYSNSFASVQAGRVLSSMCTDDQRRGPCLDNTDKQIVPPDNRTSQEVKAAGGAWMVWTLLSEQFNGFETGST